MSENQQSELLAKWLESPPGTPAPPELDQEVIEAIWSLQPERAPTARVELDSIWEAAQRPQEDEAPQQEAQVIPLAPRRWRGWIGGGTLGAIATAATILFIFRQVPMESIESSRELPLAPSDATHLPEIDRSQKIAAEDAELETEHLEEAEEGLIPEAPSQAKTKEAAKTAKPIPRQQAKPEAMMSPTRPDDQKGISGQTMSIGELNGNNSIRSGSTGSNQINFAGDAPGAAAAAVSRAPTSAPPPPPAFTTRQEDDFVESDAEQAPMQEVSPQNKAMDFDEALMETQPLTTESRTGEKSQAPTRSRKNAQKSKDTMDATAAVSEESAKPVNLRTQAEQRAREAENQVALDAYTGDLFQRARSYAKSPAGSSPQNELLALAGNPNTPEPVKVQLWFLLGELYTAQAQTALANEAYSTVLGL